MINGGIVNVVIDGVSGIAALAVLLAISWKLTLLVLAVLPLYGFLYHKINPQIRQASRDVQEQTSVISGTAVERLNGIALVQSFAQEPAETHYFAAQADELRTRAVRRGKLNNTLKAIAQMLIAIGGYMVWIVGGYMAIAESITSGQIVQFIAVAALLYLPMQRFSQINIVYQTSMAAIERVFAIFDMVPEVQNRPGVPDRTVQKGNIQFDNVSFRYGDGPLVLQDVGFMLQGGQRVAMVGESGAGKSTVATLISRLYDVTEGAILIDGIDIRDYPLRSLRRSIGIVLQETILFSGTISENLRYGRKEASEEEIIAAAKSANIDGFINSLPEGYDSHIGEHGLTLSGGQRQRMSLARTILQNPRILILDEATSSLDSESENLITAALEHVMLGRTCLIIAHRLSTIIKADCIVVLKGGHIVEQGPHDQLLATSGYYQYLFEQQFDPIKQRNSLESQL